MQKYLLLILGFLGILVLIMVYVLISMKTIPKSYSNPFSPTPTIYQNPFATQNNYQNPFNAIQNQTTNQPYQNPFSSLNGK